MEPDVPKICNDSISDVSTPEVLYEDGLLEDGANDLPQWAIQYCGQIFKYAVQLGIIDRSLGTDLRNALKPGVKKIHDYIKASELPDFIVDWRTMTEKSNQAGTAHLRPYQ